MKPQFINYIYYLASATILIPFATMFSVRIDRIEIKYLKLFIVIRLVFSIIQIVFAIKGIPSIKLANIYLYIEITLLSFLLLTWIGVKNIQSFQWVLVLILFFILIDNFNIHFPIVTKNFMNEYGMTLNQTIYYNNLFFKMILSFFIEAIWGLAAISMCKRNIEGDYDYQYYILIGIVLYGVNNLVTGIFLIYFPIVFQLVTIITIPIVNLLLNKALRKCI